MIQSAMILAAGLGKRMRPLTNTLPKPLIPVAGKTMLERTFSHIKEANISNIVVNTHYLVSQIEEAVFAFHPEALISYEKIVLETGGGIQKALPLLKGNSFFTLNGDSIWSGSLSLKTMETGWNEAQWMPSFFWFLVNMPMAMREGETSFCQKRVASRVLLKVR
jgi:MurNAc alpha-1-phosphate uridylyltransferase